MAGGDDSSQEKSEKPTPKRLRDARKKGQVAKSKDLETVVVFIGAFACIAFFGSMMWASMKEVMEKAFHLVDHDPVPSEMYALGKSALISVAKSSAPFLLGLFLISAIVGFFQVGPIFSFETLKPQLNKLNAIENLKNMFKMKTVVELVKNIFKMVIVGMIAYYIIKSMMAPFLLTVTSPIEVAAKVGNLMVTKFMIRFILFFMLIAVIDIYFQRKEFMKNLMMSKEEVKREYKEDEGDPHIKHQRKQIHQEMAMGDAKQAVKGADAIVTNPTHLAIAIKYDKKDMMAPQIVAKGQRMYAEFIKELAKEYDIPVVRNVPLAWALIEMEVGDDVPEKLYVAVAEILTFVYRLKQERESKVSE